MNKNVFQPSGIDCYRYKKLELRKIQRTVYTNIKKSTNKEKNKIYIYI